ncbi:MAG: zincin-like metallopeptidase domain-containing protein [Nanoarchaeota archaeon]|nr:zincin-like metallopeptidase domain-containing protein [Nanoarchaeota archaeon]
MGAVYQIITERVISLLEKGTVPWHKPWDGGNAVPRSLVTNKPYRGVNAFVLGSAGYESPYWLSFKQARERDGIVRKGERGSPCVYWNWINKNEDNSHQARRIPFLRYYTLFNVEQCEGIPYPKNVEKHVNNFTPIVDCEQTVEAMPLRPSIQHGGQTAFYRPLDDLVNMPCKEHFEASADYYSTLFHELSHSTGHESRLSRPGVMSRTLFGSNEYSKEELVAEMGAAFLCGHCGIENRTIDNSAAYIRTWLENLKRDNRLVVQAAAQAQKSTDYILNQKGGGEHEKEA